MRKLCGMEDPDRTITAARMLKVGRNVAAARKRMNVTQEYLAEVLQISQPNVARLEGGKRAIKLRELELIADALNTTVQELIGTTPSAVAEARVKYGKPHKPPESPQLRLVIQFTEDQIAPESELVRKLEEMIRRINAGEF